MDEEIMAFNIPMIGAVKQSEIPSPEEYTYWHNRNSRVFFIDYTIDENYDLIELSKTIIQMNIDEKDIPKDELKPIYIMIQSPGGDTYQTQFFCDLLITSRIPIVTVAMGIAFSAAFDILIAGHRRYAFKHTQTMTHSGWAGFQGTQAEVEEAQRNNRIQLNRAKDYILSRTSIEENLFNKKKNKDWYISGEDLVKYHIVDKLIDSFDEIF